MRDNYAAYLEEKLVTEFKEKFRDKLGYEPIVLTKTKSDGQTEMGWHLTLDELEACFEPFLPKHFGNILRLQAKSRKRDIVELRNMFCALAREMGHTHSDIGRFLGGRDHTTVIHNVKTFNDLISQDERYREKYKRILKSVKLSYESPDMELLDQTLPEPEPALLP